MIRFGFELRPLAEVGVWGGETLRLLQYADGSFVDYYVVRFWEDLLQLLPVVLQDVPDDLVDFVSGDSLDWNEVGTPAAGTAVPTRTPSEPAPPSCRNTEPAPVVFVRRHWRLVFVRGQGGCSRVARSVCGGIGKLVGGIGQ
jgi:hypothetical protein